MRPCASIRETMPTTYLQHPVLIILTKRVLHLQSKLSCPRYVHCPGLIISKLSLGNLYLIFCTTALLLEFDFASKVRVPDTPCHKVHKYKEYLSVQYVLCWNWYSPTPSLARECAPPPRTRGGTRSPRVRGWGSPNSDD
jgi:hypothetical protein